MKLVRIGDKIINRERLYRLVDDVLALRSSGATQQDVANTYDLERPFVSNLERLGEVRVGRKIALVGFSVSNKRDVKKIARERGIDSVHLFNGEILAKFIAKAEKVDERGVLKRFLKALSNLRDFDLLIFLGQGEEAVLLEKTLGIQVFNISAGSRSESGFQVDREELEEYLDNLIPDKGGNRTERSSKRKLRFFAKGPRSKGKSFRRRV